MRLWRWLERISSESWFLYKQGNRFQAILYFLLSTTRSKNPVTVRLGGRWLLIRPTTPDLAVARSCFDGEFVSAIRAATGLHHSFIIDAGGYIGTAALMFAEAFPHATVLTLEPSAENFKILCENIKIRPNIVAIQKALGPDVGSVQLRNRGTGEWGFSTVEKPADNPTAIVVHDVEVTTIPELLERYSATGVDLLKLDIEGAELELLKDRPAWIGRCRVIIAELHDRIVPGCTEAFDRATINRARLDCGGEKVLSIAAW